jgi:RimJ/RimL family protein N-acetyltransferase
VVVATLCVQRRRDDKHGCKGDQKLSHGQTSLNLLDYSGRRVPMFFELQPTLTGTLIGLRPLQAADFDDLYAIASDPLIWEQHPSSDRYRPEVFREFFREAMESGGAFVVIDRATGRIIGSSRYYGYDEQRSEIEIGWTFLARAYWGGVYNREMKELMLRHAFRFVDTVIFLVGPQNFRSQRAVEKIGGVRTGMTVRRGRESVVFEISKSDAYLSN